MIKIITDSTISVRRAEADELNIRIVPISYTLGGSRRAEFYTDYELCGDFEKNIRAGERIETLRPSPSVFAEIFREETSRGHEPLCITLSSRLSGIYNSASIAASSVSASGGSVHVFDSRLCAGGLYLLVCEARRLVGEGKSISEILITLEKKRDKIKSYFSVGDMSMLRESKRIGFVRARVGTMLNMRPILLCRDGVVEYDTTARGASDMIKKLADKIPAGEGLAVIDYIGGNRIASNLYNVIKSRHPGLTIRLSRLGPVLAAKLGLEVVALSCIEP